MSHKALSSIIVAVDRVLPCTLARPPVTCRHTMKIIKKYPLGQVKLSQTNPIAVDCIRVYINLNCFSIIHKG